MVLSGHDENQIFIFGVSGNDFMALQGLSIPCGSH